GGTFPDIETQIAALNEPRLDSVRELAWLGLLRDATAELKAVAAAHPDNPGVAFRLADLYSQTGEPFKAINLLQRSFRQFVRHGISSSNQKQTSTLESPSIRRSWA